MDISSIHRIERLNYILGAVLVAAAALLASKVTALGVLVGVVLSCVNFSAMKRILPGLMRNAARGNDAGRGGNSRTSGLLLVPKMALLMGAVVLALLFLPINAEGLAIGFSVFLVSIAIETVRFMSSQGALPSDDDGVIGDDADQSDPEI